MNIYIILILLLIFKIINEWTCKPNYNINNRNCKYRDKITKDGLFYKENLLPYYEHKKLKDKYYKKYDTNTIEIDVNDTFLNNKNFINYLRKITKQPTLQLVNKNDKRQAWLRYYDNNIKNLYELFHVDGKRYNCNAFQYRVVYCIYNKSDASFITKKNNCKEIELPTKENSLVIIEAENLVHRVNFNKGCRLMLMADYTTDLNRGIHGNLVYVWDNIWFKLQKIISKLNI